MSNFKKEYIECDCKDWSHTLRLSHFDWKDPYPPSELYFSFHINPNFKWYKRIWLGIKYMLGFHQAIGHYGEHILTVDEVKKFIKFSEEFLVSEGCEVNKLTLNPGQCAVVFKGIDELPAIVVNADNWTEDDYAPRMALAATKFFMAVKDDEVMNLVDKKWDELEEEIEDGN